MKRIVTTGLTLTVIVLLAACSSKEEKGSLSEKKNQLADLQKEQQAISDKIKTLEEAIQKMDTTANFGLTKQVVVTPLVLQNFSHYIDLQGKIDAQDISYVSPRGMGGQVRSLLVKQGDRVRKGQLLLKLDDAIARQGLASAQQGAESVKTQLALAKNLYQRQKNLYDQGIGAEVQLLNSKNNVDALENQLKQANEGIKMAQEQLNLTNVYSDVDGVADVVAIRVGEMFQGATAAGPQIKIVNTSRLKAVVDVPENYLSSIKKGTEVIIEIPDVNKKITSSIDVIGQQINANSRTVIAEIKIPTDGTLKPNQLAKVKIKDYASNNAMVIPMMILQTDEKGKFVYVEETEKGKKVARKKMVTVGSIYGEFIEVLNGLQEGSKLITKGFQGLYDGQAIAVN